jgi:hypothetical protein
VKESHKRRLSQTQIERLKLNIHSQQRLVKKCKSISNEREILQQHIHAMLSEKEEKHRKLK